MFARILMVCTANLCRSPMAEALLARWFAERATGAVVESAGLAARVGHPAHPMAQQLMRERGLDLSRHQVRQLTPELLSSFELTLVMEAAQQRAVEALVPSARGRVHRLGRWGDFDVPDPYGQPRQAFERSLSFIERGLDDFKRAFWSHP